MSNDDFSEKRRDDRYRHRAYGILKVAEQSCPAYLLNISKSGALVAVIDENPVKRGDEIVLALETENDNDPAIELNGTVAHVKNHYIGLQCPTLPSEAKEKIVALIAEIAAKSEPIK